MPKDREKEIKYELYLLSKQIIEIKKQMRILKAELEQIQGKCRVRKKG